MEKKGSAGRPSLLSPELAEEIVRLVEAGDAAPVAAGACGIGRATFYEWMARGEKGELPFADFRTAIACARDRFESSAREIVLNGDSEGMGFGRAKAHLETLSRRVPSRWSQRIKHEVDESNRLLLEVVNRVCRSEEIYARVREAGDLSPVLISICTELSGLDGQESAGEDYPAAGVH